MQGNTDERLSEEVAQNETHIETAGSPSTNAPGYTEECDGLNSDMDLLESGTEQGDDKQSFGLRRSSRMRKEPDKYGEWTWVRLGLLEGRVVLHSVIQLG